MLAGMSEKQLPEPRVRVFTTKGLLADGKSAGQIKTLVSNGLLVPIGRGVYVPRAVAREFATVQQCDHVFRAAAVVAHNGPTCAVSHETAA